MNSKVIQDIRLYKSEAQNEFGNYNITSFSNKTLNAIITRIVMKLRENNFSLGEFDHLYINFTTRDIPDKICLSSKVDRYHPWYRYCDVQIEQNIYEKLDSIESKEEILNYVSTVLVTCFATSDFEKTKIVFCVHQAIKEGESMLMKFKEKVSSTRKAVIYLRYLDICKFSPLLQVFDTEGNLLFEKDLPEAIMLDYLGDIQVSAKKITIKPRKNAFTKECEPLVFKY